MNSKKHVLIVDDQKELYDILSKFLNNKDYTITYKKAEEAIDFISKEEKIDLTTMPYIDIGRPNITDEVYQDLWQRIHNYIKETEIKIIPNGQFYYIEKLNRQLFNWTIFQSSILLDFSLSYSQV